MTASILVKSKGAIDNSDDDVSAFPLTGQNYKEFPLLELQFIRKKEKFELLSLCLPPKVEPNIFIHIKLHRKLFGSITSPRP